MWKKLVVFFVLMLAAIPAGAIEKQVVAGAGPSTKIAEQFFATFSQRPAAKGCEFVVPPMSTKHSGGIKNTDSFLFGRTGRPLNDQELALNKRDIFLARVPIAFASGDGAKRTTLSIGQIEKIFRGEIQRWSEVGGPNIEIVTVGRENGEALYSELRSEYPAFQGAKFDVVFKTDDEVVNFLKSPVGQYALAFGARPNFSELKILEVKGGFRAGARLGLVYDLANENHPLVKAAKELAASAEWRDQVVSVGLIPL